MSDAESTAGGLSRERFARVREVFSEACLLPREQREAFAREHAGNDAGLLGAVLELLAADQESSAETDDAKFVGRVLQFADGSDMPERIGPYRVRRVIGQGGMGVVYLAEQENPQREVAIKIVRRGSISAGMQARFGREIRVLGRLEHPGITRIYEAGSAQTPEGPVAYFAMEYVQGQRLTEAVTELKLDVAARVELVAKLADAVQHAHTKGVIHRDLKPANVLVTGAVERTDIAPSADSITRSPVAGPQPKILDFGVARVLEPDSANTAVTEAGLIVGTIGYMSPEQLDGDTDAVDARSDVYAMGVILYELIAGQLPHDLRGKPLAEAARIIRDQLPAPLTTVVQRRAVDRDLDTIVQRAMAKDRERRYATAAAFADDLRRYLRNEPIMARPPTAAYQLSKFARRNRALVCITTISLLALVGGLIFSSVMYLRAERSRRLAADRDRLSEAVRTYMIDGLLMSAAPNRKGYDVKMLDVLTTASEGLHERFADHPEIEGAIRFDLGSILCEIGKFEESKAELLAAIPLLEKSHGPDSFETIRAVITLAGLHQQMRKDEPWLAVARDALARCNRAFAPDHEETLLAQSHVGGALIALGRYKEARPVLEAAVALAEQRPDLHFESLSVLLNWVSQAQIQAGDVDAVMKTRQRSVELVSTHYGPEHERTLGARMNLAMEFLKRGDIDQAIRLAEGIPEAIERKFPPGHPTRSAAYQGWSIILRDAGRFEEAEKYCMMSYDIQVALAKEFDWMTEQAIKRLRNLYSRWPGHNDQLREWGLQAVKARFMLSHANEMTNPPTVLTTILNEWRAAGLTAERTDLLDLVWARRDQFAPEGHPRRAAFYANFAKACIYENHREHAAEALQLAEASTSYAIAPQILTPLMDSVREIAR